ncbi:class I SAM-dependent methyltransferase [Azohydromonas aeria]|uniref:class I SAM-dependent methyltransferase n=1 Tax=Azohydromonas aeria TaxID=2590212 RepID=UPI0012F74B07|nr:methyltransferase domain-containing protein [Azohydromonas aeria]
MINTPLKRLQLGCGPQPAPGWINADWTAAPGVDLVGDLRQGLPLDSGSIDHAVAMHLLQDLFWPDIPGVLREVRRVLRPRGVLRLGLPDMERAIAAWQRGDAAYFYVPDKHARSIGAKLVTQLIWYGSVHTPFNYEFAQELLQDAGFHDIRRCAFHESACGIPGITDLDNRERESFFIEARA